MNPLLNELIRIYNEKNCENKFPRYALRREVHIEGLSMDEIEALAKDLESRGMIRIGQTLNDIYYELKQA